MWFMRDRVRRGPLHWVFGYYALVFGVLTVVAGSFIEGGGPGWAALGGVLFGALMTSVIWRERKRQRP